MINAKDEGVDDAVSIVSGSTQHSEETVTDTPAVTLQEDFLLEKYDKPINFQIDTQITDAGEISSPLIPFNMGRCLQVPTDKSFGQEKTKTNIIIANVDVNAAADDVDDDCSQMSEVLIPLKQTSLTTKQSTTLGHSSPVNMQGDMQDESQFEFSQSILPSEPRFTEHLNMTEQRNTEHLQTDNIESEHLQQQHLQAEHTQAGETEQVQLKGDFGTAEHVEDVCKGSGLNDTIKTKVKQTKKMVECCEDTITKQRTDMTGDNVEETKSCTSESDNCCKDQTDKTSLNKKTTNKAKPGKGRQKLNSQSQGSSNSKHYVRKPGEDIKRSSRSSSSHKLVDSHAVDLRTRNSPVHKTRSATGSQPQGFHQRSKFVDNYSTLSKINPRASSTYKPNTSHKPWLHKPKEILSQKSEFSRLTKEDTNTDKLNLRIGKLLSSIYNLPARQQEVIKTTVEHIMMKLQDDLEKKLSSVSGTLDSVCHGRLKNLLLVIQSNLMRVMRFYKTEGQGQVKDQPSLAGMHLQHKKNLLAIGQRHRMLVKRFKDLDRGNHPKLISQVSSTDLLPASQASLDISMTSDSEKLVLSQTNTYSTKDGRNGPGILCKSKETTGNSSYKRFAEDESYIKNKRQRDDRGSAGINLLRDVNGKKTSNKSKTAVNSKEGLDIVNKTGTRSEMQWLEMLHCDSNKKRERHPRDRTDGLVDKSKETGDNTGQENGDGCTKYVDDLQTEQAIASLESKEYSDDADDASNDNFSDDESVDILTATKVTQCLAGMNEKSPTDNDTVSSQKDGFLHDKGYLAKQGANLIKNFPNLPHDKEGLTNIRDNLSSFNFTNEHESSCLYFDNIPEKRVSGSIKNKNPKFYSEVQDNHSVDSSARKHRGTPNIGIEVNTKVRLEETNKTKNDVGNDGLNFSVNYDQTCHKQMSPASSCVSSDIFMVKTKELERRQNERAMTPTIHQTSQSMSIPDIHRQIDRVTQKDCLSSKISGGKGAYSREPQPDFNQINTDNLIDTHADKDVVIGSNSKTLPSLHVKPTGNDQMVKPQTPVIKMHNEHKMITYTNQQKSWATPVNLNLQSESKKPRTTIFQPPIKLTHTQGQIPKGQDEVHPGQGQMSERSNPHISLSQDHRDDFPRNEFSYDRRNTVGMQKSTSISSWRELLADGTILPGTDVLSVLVKGIAHRASLTTNGKIQDSRGVLFNTPAKWMSSLTSGQPVKQMKAYQQILYRGKLIKDFCRPTFVKVDDPRLKSANGTQSYAERINGHAKLSTENTVRKTDQGTQTEAVDKRNCTSTRYLSDSDKHLNELISRSVVHLLKEKDFVSCKDLPSNFWTEDFSKVKLYKTVWDSITCW